MQLQAWPPARVERLTTLWRSTLGTSEIAQTINQEFPEYKPVTVHAVTHKAKADGLPARGHKRCETMIARRLIANGSGGFYALTGGDPQEPTFFADDCETEPLDRPTLAELGRDQCKWPVWSGSPYRFCGAPTHGHVYCEPHHRRSIRGMVQMTRAEIDGLRV